MTRKENLAPLSTLGVAFGSALIACFATHALHRHNSKNKSTSDDSTTMTMTPTTTESSETRIGPELTPETKYQLALRGKVDKIYEYHGPKPFEFNQEVCNVFDDMVSRSVPLYCEVIDLAIYWFQKYYQPGTKLYDLGCSTGTTIDVLARSMHGMKDGNDTPIVGHFVGIDNSPAMVDACNKKLEWAKHIHNVQMSCGDILDVDINNASFVIMNYTLQFIPVVQRQGLLRAINEGVCEGGVLLISEKVRAKCSELQETCTSIYEDFKHRRKYTKREIARKKEALMNVLIPFTEGELKSALVSAGFETVEIIAKWNNFTTFVARKKAPVTNIAAGNHATSISKDTFAIDTNRTQDTINARQAMGGVTKFVGEVITNLSPLKWQVVGYEQFPDGSLDYSRPYHNMPNPNASISKILGIYTNETRKHLQVLSSAVEDSKLSEKQGSMSPIASKRQQKKKKNSQNSKMTTPNLDRLLDASPAYLSDIMDPTLLESLLLQRNNYFAEKGGLSNNTLKGYDKIASIILALPKIQTKKFVVNEDSLVIGDADELSSDQMKLFQECIHKLKPWKKGPLTLFGTQIDTEWRSDWKWERLQRSLPDLKDKVICDLGCGNGYFMFRMLEYNPKMVIGIDPNLHAFLEFNLFQRMSGVENIKFEYLRGDCMTSFPNTFDVVYCLGVLYHTNDPIGMLRDIYKSMKGNSVRSVMHVCSYSK